MKVLGAKVEDEFYKEFKKLGNISEHVRRACQQYLDSKVNLVKTHVNHNISDDEHQSIRKELDGSSSQLKDAIRSGR